jgi:hypothetical protein
MADEPDIPRQQAIESAPWERTRRSLGAFCEERLAEIGAALWR